MSDTSLTARERTEDPVCGIEVDPANAAHRVAHKGTSYYFCGACCAETFRNSPEAVLERAAQRAGADAGHGSQAEPTGDQLNIAVAPGKYICPMCPGVRSDAPAACPK